jgi:site-specific DNA recombinase
MEKAPMKPAAIYARVSSDRQKEEHTIASQTEALRAFASQLGFSVPAEWVFEDEGYSGATLIRPGLEKVRDLAAEGQIYAVLVHSPDRLSRKYAYQVLLMEEFARNNIETLFINAPQTATPEDQLLLQFQGMIAEYAPSPPPFFAWVLDRWILPSAMICFGGTRPRRAMAASNWRRTGEPS